jgi:hypothetical protein
MSRCCARICARDAAGQAETGETLRLDTDMRLPVDQDQRDDSRRPETPETHVVWLITQRPMACPLRARSGGQRRELTVTRGQPQRAAEQRTGRLTRCANRPFKLVIRSLHLSVPGFCPRTSAGWGSPSLTSGKVQKGCPFRGAWQLWVPQVQSRGDAQQVQGQDLLCVAS